MLIHRALSAFILGPIALWLVWRGDWYYFIPITIVMLLASIEYVQIGRRIGWRIPYWLLLPAVAAQMVAAQWPARQLTAPIAVVTLLAMVLYALYRYEIGQEGAVSAEWFAAIFGVVVLGWLCGHFLRVRTLDQMAWQWTMAALVTTWLVDTAAFLVGKYLAGRFIFGKHKLAPRLSPNKTVEGYVGGLVVGVAVAMPVGLYLFKLPLFPLAVLGLLIGLVSPAGDLAISLLKREAGVKDSGKLLPGHGGALDRIDSLMWSVTFAYYIALYLGGAP